MKRQVTFLGILMLLLILSACSQDEQGLSAEEEQQVVQIARPAADRLLERLKGELSVAIKERGFSEAIELCNLEGLPLTDSVRAEFPEIASLKRTSNKYRNHQNKPDSLEQLVLARFEAAEKRGEPLPEHMVQKVPLDGKIEYRYYKPLKTEALCLNCHGDPANFDPNVVEKLKRYYPDDRATGYQLDQFRGLIRVSVKL